MNELAIARKLRVLTERLKEERDFNNQQFSSYLATAEEAFFAQDQRKADHFGFRANQYRERATLLTTFLQEQHLEQPASPLS